MMINSSVPIPMYIAIAPSFVVDQRTSDRRSFMRIASRGSNKPDGLQVRGSFRRIAGIRDYDQPRMVSPLGCSAWRNCTRLCIVGRKRN